MMLFHFLCMSFIVSEKLTETRHFLPLTFSQFTVLPLSLAYSSSPMLDLTIDTKTSPTFHQEPILLPFSKLSGYLGAPPHHPDFSDRTFLTLCPYANPICPFDRHDQESNLAKFQLLTRILSYGGLSKPQE